MASSNHRSAGCAVHGALTVYRASAGSGKTFTLTLRYIELLLRDPQAYKAILAVTFTIKATEEMKHRILSTLYGLSNSLPSADSYMQRLLSDLSLSREMIIRRAQQALDFILHDYSNFNIETIDSFFQRVLRGVARELGLSNTLRVSIDEQEIEELAVDRLLTTLREGDKVLDWIMGYILHNISDDEGWDVVNSIKTFGKKIFQHEYKENAAALNTKLLSDDFFSGYQSSLRKIVASSDAAMTALADEFDRLLNDAGYSVQDLAYGDKGAAGYFRKLRTAMWHDDKQMLGKRVTDAWEDSSNWVKAGNRKAPLTTFAAEHLTPLLLRAEQRRQQLCRPYNTALAILSHLNDLRLLNNIEHVVREINKETNSILLADTQTILDRLMEGSDTPFVFEKIGGRISHIMIDEFQDTSIIQWRNFKKLLLNGLATAGSENLIVGDVKQSIYRWRNADWTILNDIGNDADLKGKDLIFENLSTNRRSTRRVIAFNNAFFVCAATAEERRLAEMGIGSAARIGQLYDPQLTQQNIPDNKSSAGYVSITILPSAGFNDACAALTAQHLQTLFAAEVRDEEIAILVRDNRNLIRIGNYLKELFPQHHFISDEAFEIGCAAATNIIVNAMRVVHHPYDTFPRALLAEDYQRYINKEDTTDLLLRNIDEINCALPEMFISSIDHLAALPLYDMAMQIGTLFKIEQLPSEAAHIDAFFDALRAFTTTNIPDLGTFLDYWDNTMAKKSIRGGTAKGVRLLTIHKSKGLEFEHVIIPYCSWRMEYGDTTLWCRCDEEPFAQLPIVPVSYNKIEQSYYNDAYCEEKLQNIADNLNLLYVAFTRAAQSLFVIARNAQNKGGINNTTRAGLLQTVLPQLPTLLSGSRYEDNEGDNTRICRFTYGTLTAEHKAATTTDNIFDIKPTDCAVPLTRHEGEIIFRQSNSSRAFVADDSEDHSTQEYITEGTILHAVLAHIRDVSDIDRTLDGFIANGVMTDNDEQHKRTRLSHLLRTRLTENAHPLVKGWFAQGVEVLNECALLTTDPATGQVRTLRPDRIVRQGKKMTVIDFKFGHPREEYIAQVRRYMLLLYSMGYDDVEGYLWYVYKNEIVPITANNTL